MNADAKAFFAGHKIPMEKVIIVGITRRGLSAEAIEAAAEEIHKEILSGASYRPIRLAWDIYNLAKRTKMRTDQRERDELKAIKKRLADLEMPLWRRIAVKVRGRWIK